MNIIIKKRAARIGGADEGIMTIIEHRHGQHSAASSRASRPRVYLAGKIGAYGWRDEIAAMPRVDADDAFNRNFEVAFSNFILTGPVFVSCDHGCSHGAATHGAGPGCYGGENGSVKERKRRIHNVQSQRIKRSDILFAYIETLDCFGTIAEIAYASAIAHVKFVVIAYAPALPADARNELWFVERFANAILDGFNAPVAFGIALNLHKQGIRGQPSEPIRFDVRRASPALLHRRAYLASQQRANP